MKFNKLTLLVCLEIVVFLIFAYYVVLLAVENHLVNRDDGPVNAFRLVNAYDNTSVKHYILENNLMSNDFVFVESEKVKIYLKERGFGDVCLNLSKNDFSILSGEDFVLAINVKNYQVECDYVR